jgi:carboxymethylenebutenolidase
VSLADELDADPPFTGQSEWLQLPLPGGESMPAYLARPTGAAGGSVLLAHDIFGMRAFYEGLAKRLAMAGFTALVPDVFFRQGGAAGSSIEAAVSRRTRLDERRTLDDLAAALAWLRARPGNRGTIGTLGFCMGGTFVLDLCARESDLVTVAFYGFPVPQASIAMPPPRPLDLVPAMRGPILAIWGEDDGYVGMEHVHAFARRGAEAHLDLEVQILPGLGHSYLTVDTARDADAAQRARDSWSYAVHFLQRHLAGAVRTRS